MQKLHLALDWTPNINHVGFLIAQSKGYYSELDLDVTISNPSEDNYALTPAKKVEKGIADFALCPTESLLSYQTKEQPFPLMAIATIFQEDLSAIVVKANQGIVTPKDIDGKSYASYNARYEDDIVKQMIQNDGGTGNIKVEYPKKLGIWNTVLNDTYGASWIFLNWEGVHAEALKQPLLYFRMKHYNVPYAYSPVIAANEKLLTEKQDAYSAFLEATRKGFLEAKRKPVEAENILNLYIPASDKAINLQKALDLSVSAFGRDNHWGYMKPEVVQTFLDWLYTKGLETKKVEVSQLMTNELL